MSDSKVLAATGKRRPPNAGRGRVKGVPNKTTVQARQAFQDAFDGMGGVDRLMTWAKAEPTEFYKLFARLIPQEVTASVDMTHRDAVDRPPRETRDEWITRRAAELGVSLGAAAGASTSRH